MTDETKEFASIEDATPTTAIPSETDATTATTTMVTVDDRTDTTVLPSAADDDETAVLPVPDNHADASVLGCGYAGNSCLSIAHRTNHRSDCPGNSCRCRGGRWWADSICR